MKNILKGSAADLLAKSLTAADFGKLIGVSERRVRELRDDGVLESDRAGRYPLANVSRYTERLRPDHGKPVKRARPNAEDPERQARMKAADDAVRLGMVVLAKRVPGMAGRAAAEVGVPADVVSKLQDVLLTRAAELLNDTRERLGIEPGELGPARRFNGLWPE